MSLRATNGFDAHWRLPEARIFQRAHGTRTAETRTTRTLLLDADGDGPSEKG